MAVDLRFFVRAFRPCNERRYETMSTTLMTVKQFAERHPAFSTSSLRWIIFRSADKSDPDYSKFTPAIHKVGGRVLIEEDRFLNIATGKDDQEAA